MANIGIILVAALAVRIGIELAFTKIKELARL